MPRGMLFLLCKHLLKWTSLLLMTTIIFEPTALSYKKEADLVMVSMDHNQTKRAIELNVITFNIRHGKGMDDVVSLERIIDEIKQSSPDIIGLQEVDRYNPRSGFKDQMKELGDALDMFWVFSPSLNFGLTQYGNAILSHYPIISSDVIVLPSVNETRTLVYADILIGTKKLRVYNTHLGVSTADRKQQMPIIWEAIQSTEKRALLLGDLNMTITHSLMSDLNEFWNKAEPGQPTLQSGIEVDYIFYNFDVTSIKAWTQPTLSSDHHPVVTRMKW